MKKITFCFVLLSSFCGISQNIGLNATGINPDNSAMLDVSSSNKGLLIPRIALTDVFDVVTISSPATSLLVYNTSTSGVAPNDVVPGYYYYNGVQWVKFSTGSAVNNDWSLNGNSGTTAGTNFVGTTDVQDLVFKTNNGERWRMLSSGNYDLRTTSSHMWITKPLGDGGIKIGAALKAENTNYFIGDSIGVGVSAFGFGAGGRSSSIGLGYNLGTNAAGGHSNMIMIGRNIFTDPNSGSGIDHATLIGADAATMGGDGVIIGGFAGQNGFSDGVIIGKSAGRTGGNNSVVFIGEDAGRFSTSTNGNTFLGYRSGYTNTNGSNNTFLGYGADATSTSFSNATAIGYNAKAGASNTVVIGDNNVNVGIKTSTPNSTLQVNGSYSAAVTTTVGASYTITGNDQVIIHRGAASNFNLPSASSCIGRIYNIINLGTGTITFNTPIEYTNGGTYNTLCSFPCLGDSGFIGATAGNSVTVISDGTNWIRLGI